MADSSRTGVAITTICAVSEDGWGSEFNLAPYSTERYSELILLQKRPETPDQAIAGQYWFNLPLRRSGLCAVSLRPDD